ncbi:hypothetical protein [Natronospora cellulosivora (SeqCode)]
MKTFFPCKIHNTDDTNGDKPAYAILSFQEDFDLFDAIKRVKESSPKNIFIIINGQQSGHNKAGHETDKRFGLALCGTNRIGDKIFDWGILKDKVQEIHNAVGYTGVWQGDYRIYTSFAYRSVASVLFDEYGERDLIINIVNAKYEWGQSKNRNTASFENFCNDLKKILVSIKNITDIRFFIAGFSRGGMFALRLGQWLSKYGKERIVVTIDPVQNRQKEHLDWALGWGRWRQAVLKRNRGWEKVSPLPLPLNWDMYRFPILKGKADKHYNVFQRFIGPDHLAWPRGSAVNNAIAPGAELTGNRSSSPNNKYSKLPDVSPFDQLDISCNDHTMMPKKYREWVLDIAHKHFEALDPIRCTPSQALPGSHVNISRSDDLDSGNIFMARQVYIDQRQIDSVWNKNKKIIDIEIPEDLSAGEKYIFAKDPGPYFSTSFIVEPFIRYARNSPKRGFPKTKIVITGSFPMKKNRIYFDDMEINPHYSAHGFYFEVPECQGGLKEIKILHDEKWYSNSLEFVVCDRIANRRSKELHLEDCPWLKLMSPNNKVELSLTYDNPKKDGYYDACHWCHVRKPHKMGPSKSS